MATASKKIEALKITPMTYQKYVDVSTGVTPLSLVEINNTFIVRNDPDLPRVDLAWYDDRDFHHFFKWVNSDEAARYDWSEVQKLDPED